MVYNVQYSQIKMSRQNFTIYNIDSLKIIYKKANVRSKDKKFDVGEQVIVLALENVGKLCNRWQGPGTVIKVKSPHSYLVDMGNGNVRHIHANKMRKFIARVQG